MNIKFNETIFSGDLIRRKINKLDQSYSIKTLLNKSSSKVYSTHYHFDSDDRKGKNFESAIQKRYPYMSKLDFYKGKTFSGLQNRSQKNAPLHQSNKLERTITFMSDSNVDTDLPEVNQIDGESKHNTNNNKIVPPTYQRKNINKTTDNSLKEIMEQNAKRTILFFGSGEGAVIKASMPNISLSHERKENLVLKMDHYFKSR